MLDRNGLRTWLNVGCILILLGTGNPSFAKQSRGLDTARAVPVSLVVPGLGKMELEIFSKGGKQPYLPLTTIFKALRIKYDYNVQGGSIKGFLAGPQNEFDINIPQRRISARDSTFSLSESDFIVNSTDFYLRNDLYGRVFALEMQYNPRSLTVRLKTSLKLPVFLEHEREQARKRELVLAQGVEVDTAFSQAPLFLSAGRFDWNIRSSLSSRGQPRYLYDLGLGNAFLGGDLQTSVRGEVHRAVATDDLHGRLRYAFLDASLVRQITLGDVFQTGILPLSTFGAEITNRPAPRRLVFAIDDFDERIGSSQMSDFYIRNQLTATGTSSAEGDLRFSSSLPYGITDYETHSYDEFGVEHVTRYRVTVPNTLLPPGQVEYSLIGGKLRQRNDEWSGDFALNWGVSHRLTVGAGVDYLKEENIKREWHPSVSASARVTNLLTADVTVAPSAFSQGVLTLATPSLAGGTLSYQRFDRNVFYNPMGLIDETFMNVYIPLVYSNSRFGFDATIRKREFSDVRQWSPRVGVTCGFGSVTLRLIDALTIADSFSNSSTTVIQHVTSPTISAILPAAVIFHASGFYDQLASQFTEIQVGVLKMLSHTAFVQLFYERSFPTSLSLLGVQLSYYFPFAYLRTSVSRESEADEYRFGQSVGGSIGLVATTGDLVFDHLSDRVGVGGIFVHPFLDANGNGVQDKGEQFLGKARVNATVASGLGTGLTLSPDLGFALEHTQPYEKYIIRVDPESFDDPLWTPKFSSLSVISEPDRFRVIPLPVLVGGVVRGSVKEQVADTLRLVEGIEVKIRSVETGDGKPRFMKTIITVSTGEFEFIGVPPGQYIVSVNEEMAARLGKVVQPPQRDIEVISKLEGTEVANVDFILK